MKQEMRIATIENIVTAFCFGAGALLIVVAVHTLSAVQTVNAVNLQRPVSTPALAAFDNGSERTAGTYSGRVTEISSSPGKAN